MKQVSLRQFKTWAKAHHNLAYAVAQSMAYAQCKREQVDAYIKPVFDLFDFYVKPEWRREGDGEGRITSPKMIYLSDQEELVAEFFEECDKEHRKNGFNGPKGHCPALEAEHLQVIAENALLEAGAILFGIEDIGLYGDNRKKMLDLLMGACLKKAA